MPLSAYQYRPLTPPAAAAVPELDFLDADHSPSFSDISTLSGVSFQDGLQVRVPNTPFERSPIRQHGPTLLPKIRTQDQSFKTPVTTTRKSHRPQHRRAVSQSFIPPPSSSSFQTAAVRPTYQRSTTVPPELDPFTPSSAISTTSSCFPFLSPITPISHSNNASPITIAPPWRPTAGHYRSTSASCINELGYTKYNNYNTTPAAYWTPTNAGSAIYTPTTIITPIQRQQSQPVIFDLPEEQQCTDPSGATMIPLEYMRMPNPSFELVRHTNRCMSKTVHHFWWDIRNLEEWDGFNLDTIMQINGFEQLLNMPVPDNEVSYPKPRIDVSRQRPEVASELTDIIKDFYLTKLNALMKITQGSRRYMGMHLNKDKAGPTFTSNYQDDTTHTITGSGRGRLVGIALPWSRWNSGKSLEPGYEKMLYLDGLATLQYHMRNNNCRYGFIMNETELLCVRAGTSDTPFFGHLELSPIIESRRTTGVTTCLALWYLSMLAKEQSLPGQCGWKINVGPPIALTRQLTFEEKDEWIPKPTQGEMRVAKRNRGWVWPKDAYNKKREGGGGGGNQGWAMISFLSISFGMFFVQTT